MNTIENFHSIAAELINSAASDKARAFAEKIVLQIEAKGEEWINAHKAQLYITMHASQQTAAPVADNRVWYLGKWQMALLG